MNDETNATERAFRRRVRRRNILKLVVVVLVPLSVVVGYLLIWGTAFGYTLSEILPFLGIVVVVGAFTSLLVVGITALTT